MSNTNGKILLIGGCADGLRRQVPSDQRVFKIAAPALSGTFADFSDTPEKIEISTSIYRRVRGCRADGTIVEVAVCTEAQGDLIDLLIKGYRGHRNPRRK